MEPTDGELLERWRAGDDESGERLFDRYYDMVERFFLNKVNDAAQDLVQETFTRCVQGREQIKEQDKFRVYLFGVAFNVLHVHLRKRYRGGQTFDIADASVRAVEPGPVTQAVQRREHRVLLEGLRSIPVQDQAILELYYWEDLTTDEIAEVLGIPQGTARGRLQRARDKLGEAVNRLLETPQDLASTVARLEDWARDCRGHLDSYCAK